MESSHSRLATAGSKVGRDKGCVGTVAWGVGAADELEGTAGASGGVFACAGLGIGGAVGSCGHAVSAKISVIKINGNRFIGRT